MVVDADVRDVRRHQLKRFGAANVEKTLFAGRIELEQGRAELKSLRPLRPAA